MVTVANIHAQQQNADLRFRRIAVARTSGYVGARLVARQRGLRRFRTPPTAHIHRNLVEGLRNATVVRDRRALEDFTLRPMDFPEAMARAISGEGK